MVNVYLRKKRRSSSGTLFVTFLLGAAIGFSVAYAVFAAKPAPAAPRLIAPLSQNEPLAQPPDQEPAPVREEPPAQPEPVLPEAESPLAETPAAEQTAPPPGNIWPGRFLFIAAPDVIDDAAADFLAEVRPGGVLLRDSQIAKNPENTRNYVSKIKRAAGFGTGIADLPLIAVEQEGGRINPLRLDPAPSAAQLAKTADTKAALELGRAAAQAARNHGIGVVFAPVLAVLPEGVKNDAMADRVFGSDQEFVANMGLAFADGLALGGAVAVAKYYPGLGIARKRGSRLQMLNVESPTLSELMYPFWEAATATLPGMLAGHVAVPSLDLYNPDRPASMSPILIRRILRDDWSYSGVILADDVCAEELQAAISPPKAAVDALIAGCDAVLVLDPDAVKNVCGAIEKAIKIGRLSEDDLNQSRKRLESWQTQLADYAAPDETAGTETPPETEPVKPQIPEPQPAEPAKPEHETPAIEETPESQQPEPIQFIAPPPLPEITQPQPQPEKIQPPPEPESPEPKPRPEETEPVPETPEKIEPGEEMVEIIHDIKPGEMLSGIAQHYGVKQDDIVKWNNLKSKNIKYGFKLKIYRPASAPPLSPSPKKDETSPQPEAEPAAESDTPEKPEPGKQPSVLLANRRKYVVKAGDTLQSISSELGIDAKIIRAWNGLESDDVSEGQVLVIFASGADAAPAATGKNGFYIVKEGDNAYRIAEAFGIDLETLLEMNKEIKDPNILLVGQRIAVPKKP